MSSLIPSKVFAEKLKASKKAVKKPRPVTIDFETYGIESRPVYPPVPVGVSIKLPGKKAHYYAWGHPTKNNCTKAQGVAALKKVWNWVDGLLFQNGKFDVDVAEVHCGLKVPPWQCIHDTLFLLFLDDPHQLELSLKPSAARLLDMPPDEQETVRDWLLEHQPVPNVKISKSKGSEHYWARYIAFAPGDIVGAYADGDTIRTEKLFDLLWIKTVKRGMLAAYDRERQLMPMLLDMERTGVPVDVKRLKTDVALYRSWLDQINAWVMRKLKVKATSHGAFEVDGEWVINLDSGQDLVEAMVGAKVVDTNKMPLTTTGKYQYNKEALLLGVTDKQLLAVLKYRTQLQTCLRTFMEPWLRTATRSNGLIFTTWNQTKTPSGRGSVGTRTGRLSATPNFQNIPNEFKPIFSHDEGGKGLARCPWNALPRLPDVRSYVTPFKGEVLVDRDYSQQEPRILAHFDGGDLMKRYLADPWIDLHDYAKAELAKAGKHYERKRVKNTNLGLIYGMGVGLLAEKNEMPVDEASALKKAVMNLYPGLKAMYADMKVRARTNVPIRTWGGREYYCEPPKLVDGRIRQGSAADATKEAISRFLTH